MQEEPEKQNKGEEPAGGDPVLPLIIASIVGAALWNVFMAAQCGGVMGLLFALVFGLWYFLAVLVFFMKTNKRWKWETAAFVIIGLLCYYHIYWSQVTPGYLRSDAQAGLVFVFGPIWAGMAALAGDAVVVLGSLLVRAFIGKKKEEQ
ncbi:hypothetical protein [Akkermansia sp.]|uniref:hypothetical protein n=1 Tax=Akkermansia sp. TaxID=1872421 RepID=UPI0025B9F187|nr:hypothetical protein [Akkermansia sp.]MCC8148621.1 hypothetical protein [Akkermansia sp.]